jgi:hypothetical protein
MELSPVMIVATLIAHVLYGVALGLVYGWLLEGDSNEHGNAHPLVR